MDLGDRTAALMAVDQLMDKARYMRQRILEISGGGEPDEKTWKLLAAIYRLTEEVDTYLTKAAAAGDRERLMALPIDLGGGVTLVESEERPNGPIFVEVSEGTWPPRH